MRRRRVPYANRSVWYAVAILTFVVVIGFAGAGYEINHLRTEVNGLNVKITALNQAISTLYQAMLKLFAQAK